MPDWLSPFLQRLRDTWNSPRRGSLLLLAGGGVLVLLLLGATFWWAAQPDWAPLYRGLSEVEAARVVSQLEEQKAAYRLTGGGGTVEVPRSELYRLRVKLAAEGGPRPAIPGYELLDEQRLGMSDREMDLMQKRALEGELAKTLDALSWVHGATVHIVQPKPSLFKDEQVPVTASVTVVTDQHYAVPRGEVAGVVALVSSAVEGLHPTRVTVVDSRGKLLTEPADDDIGLGRSNKQIELTRKVNAYYTQQAQEMLDRVVGEGRSVVRVTADLDFSYLERTSRIFDPEKKIVRSQELNEGSSTGSDTSTTQEERLITNYEVNEILEHIRGQQGALKRLSVSLVVDGTYAEGGGGKGDPPLSYVPRSAEEMQKLEQLVRTAVGFDAQRGDQIQAENLAFDSSGREQDLGALRNRKIRDMALDILRKVLFVGGIIAFLFLLRSTLSLINSRIGQAFDDKRALMLAGVRTGPVVEESYEEEVPLVMELEAARTPEQRQIARVHKKVVDYCKEHPDDAARLVRAWLYEAS
ncbi:MAG: flagellar basal-body MS-ring/collar protein FliF [bacterium]|jgi:flagellar M-ring protein FliF|nr:flagellar basal-body MS-ring/collar protein FliF [bacterium]